MVFIDWLANIVLCFVLPFLYYFNDNEQIAWLYLSGLCALGILRIGDILRSR